MDEVSRTRCSGQPLLISQYITAEGVESTGKTSSESKSRWLHENYKTYRVNLRYDTASKIIDFMELHKGAEGVTPIIREALELYIKSKGD